MIIAIYPHITLDARGLILGNESGGCASLIKDMEESEDPELPLCRTFTFDGRPYNFFLFASFLNELGVEIICNKLVRLYIVS